MRQLLALTVSVFVALVPPLVSAQPTPAGQQAEREADRKPVASDQPATSDEPSSDSTTTSSDSQQSQDQQDSSEQQARAQTETQQQPSVDRQPAAETVPSTNEQRTTEPKTTEQKGDRDDTSNRLFEDFPLRGYGAIEFVAAEAVGNVASYLGGRGGVILENIYVVGIGGYGLLNSPDNVPAIEDHRPIVGVSYGGPFFELRIFPKMVVHGRAGIMTGFGRVSYTTDSESALSRKVDNGFFFFDPYVSAEANLTNFLQAGAGLGWRATMGAELPNLDDNDLSSPTGRFYLKFGSF